jgi:hypothetical protein
MVAAKPSLSTSERRESPPRKMTNEEIEKTSQRLVQRPPPPQLKDPIELSPRIVKDKEEIDKAVERLYTVAIEQKKRKLEQSESVLHSKDTPKSVVRTNEEIEDGINRLYNQSIETLKMSREKSVQRYQHHPAQHSPRMTLDESTKRLYHDSLQKKQETRQDLFDRYVKATEVKSRKLTADEVKASADRLSSKK